MYDVRTDSWRSAAKLPRAEGSPAVAVLGGKLYAIGGRSGTDDYGTVYVYDPKADAWTVGPPIPPRGTAGAVAYRGAIYVFGGESQARFRTLADVYRLGSRARRWSAPARCPPRATTRGRLRFVTPCTSSAAAERPATATAPPAARSSTASSYGARPERSPS